MYKHTSHSMLGCKYWSANTSSWLSDGCFVSSETTYDTTVCHCYHLTTFGSDFYVPPNTIDFGSVFSKFKSLSDNCAVFATVLSIFGAYILIAIFARWKDKKDLLKVRQRFNSIDETDVYFKINTNN